MAGSENTRAQRREWRDAVEAALNEGDAAKRYEARQRDLRRGRAANASSGGRPQRPSLMRRVRHLIKVP